MCYTGPADSFCMLSSSRRAATHRVGLGHPSPVPSGVAILVVQYGASCRHLLNSLLADYTFSVGVGPGSPGEQQERSYPCRKNPPPNWGKQGCATVPCMTPASLEEGKGAMGWTIGTVFKGLIPVQSRDPGTWLARTDGSYWV